MGLEISNVLPTRNMGYFMDILITCKPLSPTFWKGEGPALTRKARLAFAYFQVVEYNGYDNTVDLKEARDSIEKLLR